MKKTMIAAAATLALSFAIFTPGDAQACGSYGPPTAHQMARGHIYAALNQHKVTRYVSNVNVALFDGRRGEATISYKNGAKLKVGLLRHRGQWVVTRHVARRRA